MQTFLKILWAKRKAIAFYGLLLMGGWFLGDVLKDLTVPVVLPFTLALQKNTAQGHGALSLD